MTHEEFIKTHQNGKMYWIGELPDDWYGKDNKWCYRTQLSHYLNMINHTVESWYESKVPNPGCLICGNEVEFHSISKGWYKTCSSACHESLMSQLSSQRLKTRWKDSDFSTKIIQLSSSRFSDLWKDPEFAMTKYIEQCKKSGITHSHLYVGTYESMVKFGVSAYPDIRSSYQKLELVYVSESLPVEIAAKLECDIKKKFNVLVCDSSFGDGWSEYRDITLLHDIINFIKD